MDELRKLLRVDEEDGRFESRGVWEGGEWTCRLGFKLVSSSLVFTDLYRVVETPRNGRSRYLLSDHSIAAPSRIPVKFGVNDKFGNCTNPLFSD